MKMTVEKEVARLALRMEELRKQSEKLQERTNALLEEIVQRLEDLLDAQERAAGIYREESAP